MDIKTIQAPGWSGHRYDAPLVYVVLRQSDEFVAAFSTREYAEQYRQSRESDNLWIRTTLMDFYAN